MQVEQYKDGKWIESEKFTEGGREVHHTAGRSACGAMRSWVQQPVAVMDAVLFKWVLEDQAKQFPCSLWMRDLSGGGGYAVQSERIMKVCNQVPC